MAISLRRGQSAAATRTVLSIAAHHTPFLEVASSQDECDADANADQRDDHAQGEQRPALPIPVVSVPAVGVQKMAAVRSQAHRASMNQALKAPPFERTVG